MKEFFPNALVVDYEAITAALPADYCIDGEHWGCPRVAWQGRQLEPYRCRSLGNVVFANILSNIICAAPPRRARGVPMPVPVPVPVLVGRITRCPRSLVESPSGCAKRHDGRALRKGRGWVAPHLRACCRPPRVLPRSLPPGRLLPLRSEATRSKTLRNAPKLSSRRAVPAASVGRVGGPLKDGAGNGAGSPGVSFTGWETSPGG